MVPAPASRTLVFRLSCWSLSIVVLGQLLTAAVALAARLEASKEVRVVEKEVEKIVTVRVPVEVPAKPDPGTATLVARAPQARPQTEPDAPPPAPAPLPTPIGAPPIADPAVERLVMEARKARVAEDMVTAITKLNEAALKSPDDPNVEYELGLVHETMGYSDPIYFEAASEHYDKVNRMGLAKAGTLYELAATKLRDGFEDPVVAVRGKLTLGRPWIFKDVNYTGGGQRVVLTVPVQTAPGTTISADDFSVTVRFFDTLRGREIVPASTETCKTDYQWISGSIDWAGGQEFLRVTYIVQPQGQQNEHLFGQRAYYGHVVELNYKNELVDLQSWPRDLAARTQQPQTYPAADSAPPEFLDKDSLPPGTDPGNPLLPALPSQ